MTDINKNVECDALVKTQREHWALAHEVKSSIEKKHKYYDVEYWDALMWAKDREELKE